MWIIFYLTKNKKPDLLGLTEEEEILVRQWLEYASIHLVRLSTFFPNDVDTILKASSRLSFQSFQFE